MLKSLFRGLEQRPENAESLFVLLDSEEDRQIARNAFQPPPPPELIPEIKPNNEPSEWLAAVTELDLGEYAPTAYVRMMSHWEPERIATLAAGFHSLPDDKNLNLGKYIVENNNDEDSPLRSESLSYSSPIPRK